MVPESLAAVLDAFVRGDLAAASDRFASGAAYREPRKPPVVGHAAIAERFARFAARGVPYRFDVDDVLVNGGRACVVYRFAEPGGEGQPWRERAGCATVRFDERGLIAEWREYEG
ncbi:MAG TPA: nuclear transport factor 2 family protein [Candidatus Elarobacter sp.]|jgi:hypothetical protein